MEKYEPMTEEEVENFQSRVALRISLCDAAMALSTSEAMSLIATIRKLQAENKKLVEVVLDNPDDHRKVNDER